MATYLQGVTDYIPQVQPFSPDYNFYSGALDLRQSKYDAAKTQISNLYGSLLNAPLSREDNAENRDKFFKTIEQDIHKMATMDLSLKQNQVAAQGVFNQLLENKSIVKDMVWTKNFESATKRSQGFKNCTDGDECGGQWWKGGDRLLDYSRKEFQMMSAEDAMFARDAEYIPAQNVTKMAMELAKEADLSVKQDQVTGQWITTTKNGPLVVQPLADLFQGVIGQDSKVQEYYTAQQRLSRKDWTFANVDQYGGMEQAEQAYIQEMTPMVDQLLGKSEKLEQEVASNTNKKEKVEEKIKDSTPADQETLADVYDDLETRGGGYEASLANAKKDEEIIQVAKNNQGYSADQIDALMSSVQLGNDINASAMTLAYKDYEQTIKENPYAMESVKQANRVQMENLKQVHALEKIDYEAAVKVELFNQGIGTGGSGSGAPGVPPSGGAENNTGEVVTDISGGTDVGSGDDYSMAKAASGFNQAEEARNEMRGDISSSEKQLLVEIGKRTQTAALNGDAQAQEDLVLMYDNYLSALGKYGEEEISKKKNSGLRNMQDEEYQNLQISANARGGQRKIWDGLSQQEKYEKIKNNDFTKIGDKLKGSSVDHLYNSTLKPMMDMGDKANVALRDYLEPVWESSHALRNEISAKDIALEQFDAHYAEAANTVAQAVKSQESKQWGDAIESYVNEEGHIVDENTFVQNMVNKGYSQQTAAALYSFDRVKEYDEAGGWEKAGAVAESVGSWGWELLKTGGTLGLNLLVEDFDPEGVSENLNEDAVGGKAVQGIHDYYKRAYSKYAKPNKDSAFLNLKGLGNEAAMGKKWTLDAAAYKSVATVGTTQFLKDALSSDDSNMYYGGVKPFSTSPGGVQKEITSEIVEQILYDLQNEHKGKKRFTGEVTYQNIAEGNKNKVAINIKIPQRYQDNYMGSKDNPGMFRDSSFDYAKQGISIIIPKSETTNLFTEGSKKSHWDYVMGYQGKIKFDQSKYAKNMVLKRDSQTGGYNLTGQLFNGLDENGYPTYRTLVPQTTFGTADLNTIIQGIDQQIYTVSQLAKQTEQDWVINNKK
jgi:hypothetical protein